MTPYRIQLLAKRKRRANFTMRIAALAFVLTLPFSIPAAMATITYLATKLI